jgi:glucosamine 6-phosphate synthetase-like amidotransferase/phosphosugar isomerase protein
MAKLIVGKKNVFFIGQGMGQCIACEGSLKMKEMTYIHSQPLSMANIENDFYMYAACKEKVPTIFVIFDSGDVREKTIMLEGMRKLKKANIDIAPIVVTDC